MRKFSDGNPLVLLAYFSAAAGIAMFTMHPVLLGLADALPYTAFTRKNLD